MNILTILFFIIFTGVSQATESTSQSNALEITYKNNEHKEPDTYAARKKITPPLHIFDTYAQQHEALQTMRQFFRNMQQQIDQQGITQELIAQGIDTIVQAELEGIIPLETGIDIFFEETKIQPNDTVLGCNPHLGGCNYSFFQLVVLVGLFDDLSEHYLRMVQAMLKHGANPGFTTHVQRGLTTEETSVYKELAYWAAFTNRHALRAEEEIQCANTEEQKQRWIKDKCEAKKSYKTAKKIKTLLKKHTKN